MSDNKEFFELLKTVINEQSFALELAPGKDPGIVACKQLTTKQLKELVKTVIDSPVTQSAFNSTCSVIFKESLIHPPKQPLNVLDRLLFLLQLRINSISPTVGEFNVKQVAATLLQKIKENCSALVPASASEDKIKITFGIPLIDVELQLNEEVYKNYNPNLDTSDPEELRVLLGETFVHEIAKSLQTISVEEKTLDLVSVSFEDRLIAVETLPASLIQKVVEYIEHYKQIINDGLTVDGNILTIDASLFSVR